MPYIKILFHFIDAIGDEEPIVELLWDYLASLFTNGQILLDYELVKTHNEIIAFVTIPEEDALNDEYNSIYVNDYCKKLKTVFTISKETIGMNLNCSKPCSCKNSSWYMVYADYSTVESPVVCGDCGKEVPLYRIPYIHSEKDHYSIVSWQQVYRSIDQVWMKCLADRFTFRQLSNPNSQLFKDGLDIRKALEEKLQKPVYYYIFHHNKPLNACPSCGDVWLESSNQKSVDYMCEKCRLATDK